MGQERLPMRKLREILRLRYTMGLGRNEIAVSVRCGRTTAGYYLKLAQEAGIGSWGDVEAFSEGELEELLGIKVPLRGVKPAIGVRAPDWTWVHGELKKSGVTLMLLWQEYLRDNPEGYRYSRFCEHYSRYRSKLNVVMRQEHKAGEKSFVDYCDGIPFLDPVTGNLVSTQLFVGVLGASSYTYAEASLSQDLPSWLSSHVRMYEFFNGVSEITVPDNLRSGVKRACYYDPEINPSYRDLAEHYGTCIIPARVRKPRDKAKVEAAVLVAQRWILAVLRNQTFTSLAELNIGIWECLKRLNERQMRHIGKSRKTLWESLERPVLKALPQTPYRFAEWKKARVNIDYHIELDDHYYSCPYTLIHAPVEARSTDTTVEIFQRGIRIASHRRSYQKGKFTTEATHRPKNHSVKLEWTPERITRWATSLAPELGQLIQQMFQTKVHPEQNYRSALGTIRLAKHYPQDRVKHAARRALDLKAPTYSCLKKILESGADLVPLPEGSVVECSTTGQVKNRPEPLGKNNLRGGGYYH
ncbi:MAG: IS21 family transposase [Bdellovibrionia bacterium]